MNFRQQGGDRVCMDTAAMAMVAVDMAEELDTAAVLP